MVRPRALPQILPGRKIWKKDPSIGFFFFVRLLIKNLEREIFHKTSPILSNNCVLKTAEPALILTCPF